MVFLKNLGKVLAVLVITFAGMAVTCGGVFILNNGSRLLLAAGVSAIIGVLLFIWSKKYFFEKIDSKSTNSID